MGMESKVVTRLHDMHPYNQLCFSFLNFTGVMLEMLCEIVFSNTQIVENIFCKIHEFFSKTIKLWNGTQDGNQGPYYNIVQKLFLLKP